MRSDHPEKEDVDALLIPAAYVLKVLGYAVPGAGAVADMTDLVKGINDRRRDRQSVRLQKLCLFINEKLDRRTEPNVRPDLYDEVVKQAVEDENDEKVRYYGALIGLVAAEKEVPASQVRMFASILGFLTPEEIAAVGVIADGGTAKDIPVAIREFLLARLQGQGIIKAAGGFVDLAADSEGLLNYASFTPLGKRLAGIIRTYG